MSSRGPTIADPLDGLLPYQVRVLTPEGALLEFRLAGVGSRFFAKVLDIGIQIMTLAIASTFVLPLTASVVGTGLSVILSSLSGFVVFFFYGLLEARGGHTPGKRAFGLKVITTDGSAVTLRHAFTRNLVWIVEVFVSLGSIPLLLALTSRYGQRAGDMAAGTMVVLAEPNRAQPVVLSMWAGRPALSDQIDPALLAPTDYGLIREFLVRADNFDVSSRAKIAERLATGVEVRSQIAKPHDYPPETYLLAVFQAARRRSWEEAPAPPPTGMPSPPPPGAFLTPGATPTSAPPMGTPYRGH